MRLARGRWRDTSSSLLLPLPLSPRVPLERGNCGYKAMGSLAAYRRLSRAFQLVFSHRLVRNEDLAIDNVGVTCSLCGIMKRIRLNKAGQTPQTDDLSFLPPYSEQAKYLALADKFLSTDEHQNVVSIDGTRQSGHEKKARKAA